jgi:hypothetical protein
MSDASVQSAIEDTGMRPSVLLLHLPSRARGHVSRTRPGDSCHRRYPNASIETATVPERSHQSLPSGIDVTHATAELFGLDVVSTAGLPASPCGAMTLGARPDHGLRTAEVRGSHPGGSTDPPSPADLSWSPGYVHRSPTPTYFRLRKARRRRGHGTALPFGLLLSPCLMVWPSRRVRERGCAGTQLRIRCCAVRCPTSHSRAMLACSRWTGWAKEGEE